MSSKNEALKKKIKIKDAKCSGTCPSCCKKEIEEEEKEVRRDKKE